MGLNTPYDVRDEGMRDLLKAYNNNFAKDTHTFTLKHRRRKAPQESIVIHSKHWNDGIFHPTFFGKEPLKGVEKLPVKLLYDSRLIRTRLNEYYLCIPQPLALKPENQRLLFR